MRNLIFSYLHLVLHFGIGGSADFKILLGLYYVWVGGGYLKMSCFNKTKKPWKLLQSLQFLDVDNLVKSEHNTCCVG